MRLTENELFLFSPNLAQENAFSWRFYFKVNRNNLGSFQKAIRDFQNNTPFKKSHTFKRQSLEILNFSLI